VNVQDTYFDADRLENFDGQMAGADAVLVNPVTDAMVPAAIEGQDWHFTIPPGTFVEPDGETLHYWSFAPDAPDHHPTWMTLTGNTLSGTPPLDAERGPDQPDDASGVTPVIVLGTDPDFRFPGRGHGFQCDCQ